MSNIQIQDIDQRVQYTATGSQTVFPVPFPFLANSDLQVYQNSTLIDLGGGAGQYGVSGAGNPSGGTVTLVTGATANDIITITGVQPIDRTSIYSATISNLTGADLNNDFNREIIMLKQIWTTQNILQIQYAPYEQVSQDEAVTIDRWVPKMAALESWRMNAAATAIETYQGLDVSVASGIKFLVQQADASLPSAQSMGALGTGITKNTTVTGVQSISAPITSIDSLTIADQKMLVGIGPDTYALADLTTYSQTLLALASLSAWQTALGIPGGGTGVYLPLSGGTMTGNIVLSGPAVAALNPVSLAQMQAAYSNQHEACLVASAGTNSLSTWAYNNGAAGVGATLTAPANGGTTFDTSIVPVDGDSVFVIEQDTNQEWHGAYTIVQGTGGTPTVLTRRADFDQAAEINPGDIFSVVSGDTYAGTQWMMSQVAAITVGTTAITFQQITGQGALLKANNLNDLLNVATARTNLGLGSMAIQAASAVAITGGSIVGTTFDNGVIGGVTPLAGTFTTLIGTTAQGGNVLLTGNEIQHVGDLTNKIVFGTATQDYQTGGSSRFDVNNSGVRFGGANARITTVLDEDDMSSDSPTALATQQSIKKYVDDSLVDSVSNPNIMIGGDFGINPWQRGTTFTAPAQGIYTADRFTLLNALTSAVVDVLKTADGPTASEAGAYTSHCLEFDVTTADAAVAAGEAYGLWYKFEGYDVAELGFGQAGVRNVTFSFWHKHTVIGTYSGAIQNSAQNRTYTFEYSQAVTNTWEKATITIPVDTSGTWLYTNGIGLYLYLCLAVGSTYQQAAGAWGAATAFGTSNQVNGLSSAANSSRFALVKLEMGSVATPYPVESYAEVFSKCRRYYQNMRILAAIATQVWSGGAYSANSQAISPTMRSTITIGFTLSGGTGGTFLTTGSITTGQTVYQEDANSTSAIADVTLNSEL